MKNIVHDMVEADAVMKKGVGGRFIWGLLLMTGNVLIVDLQRKLVSVVRKSTVLDAHRSSVQHA